MNDIQSGHVPLVPMVVVQPSTSGQWTTFAPRPIPPGSVCLAAVTAAESAAGYHAVATTSKLGHVWLHLISPTGTVKGPLTLSSTDLGGGIAPPVLSVADDGTAPVGVRHSDKVTQIIADTPMPVRARWTQSLRP